VYILSTLNDSGLVCSFLVVVGGDCGFRDILEKNAEEVVKHVVDMLVGFKVKSVILRGRSTSAGEEIIDYANTYNIDLTVLGSRGLGFFKRQVSGSVSDHVVHHAAGAVLIVKTNEKPPKSPAK